MRSRLIAILAAAMLAGCGRNQNADAERKLAEAEQKLQQANQALEDAKKSTEKAGETAAAAARQARRDDAKGTPAALAPAAPAAAAAPVAPTPPPPRVHTVAAGTAIRIRTNGQISTKTNEAGSKFEASLAEPLVDDGYVIAPKGATVHGEILESDDGGRVKGKAFLTLGLSSIQTAGGRTIAIRTNNTTHEAQSGKKKDAAKVGIATGVGAAIGAIAGGGKGAAIGAGAGAAGGTGLVLATKGGPAVIPAESVLTFQLAAPITVEEGRK